MSHSYPLYEWTITQKFNLQMRNHLNLQIMIQKRALNNVKGYSFRSEYMWIDMGVILLAGLSLFFTWKYIYEIAILYNDLKLTNSKSKYEKAYAHHKKARKKIKEKNRKYDT